MNNNSFIKIIILAGVTFVVVMLTSTYFVATQDAGPEKSGIKVASEPTDELFDSRQYYILKKDSGHTVDFIYRLENSEVICYTIGHHGGINCKFKMEGK